MILQFYHIQFLKKMIDKLSWTEILREKNSLSPPGFKPSGFQLALSCQGIAFPTGTYISLFDPFAHIGRQYSRGLGWVTTTSIAATRNLDIQQIWHPSAWLNGAGKLIIRSVTIEIIA